MLGNMTEYEMNQRGASRKVIHYAYKADALAHAEKNYGATLKRDSKSRTDLEAPAHFPKGMLPAERRGQQVLNAVNANAIAAQQVQNSSGTKAASGKGQTTPPDANASNSGAAARNQPLMNGNVKKGGGKAWAVVP